MTISNSSSRSSNPPTVSQRRCTASATRHGIGAISKRCAEGSGMSRADRARHPPLRDHYIRWLENELTSESPYRDRSYFELTTLMFTTEFQWSVAMDDNRLADGLELRGEFSEQFSVPRRAMNELGPCSFIEVLIGLSRRLSFVAGGTPTRWAWQLLVNLGLERMWDHLSRSKAQSASYILETVMSRSYNSNGGGGFFPLAWPDRDQRDVELWYQLNA